MHIKDFFEFDTYCFISHGEKNLLIKIFFL